MLVNLKTEVCWIMYLLASDADDYEEFRHGCGIACALTGGECRVDVEEAGE